MKYSNTVEYNISTKLDASGLTKLQAQIKQLETSMQKMSNKELIDDEKISAAKTQLEGLNSALTKSFNPSLGILDLSKFRLELESSGVSAKGLQSAFSMMGAEGKAALNGLTTQIANFNGGMERTSSTIDKVFTTFSNTFRWGLVSSFFSQFMNAIHSSVDYVKELDDSLTQIMLVTDYNKDSMNEFARSANEAAKAVSMTTTGMTNASLIFAQQGYNLNQSQELATLSAKVANASQQDTATTSDQITAYMNAYGLENSIEDLTQAMDNWALIANISAADVGELAQASQRAASMANAVGVNGEQLASQIATIESVTREAPEQIGNGLKTLYARFSDIAAGGEDEDGFTLGKVTSQLDAIGVQVFDKMGQIRDVGDIMEDLMVIWDDLDQTSKVAASQALAGKYQVNRFMALMDNSDMYREYKGATGASAAGTLDQMNAEFANSIEGRSAKMQASLEGLFSTIFNTDDIYPWMDAAQGAVDLLQQFFDALGGGKVVLLGISSLLTQVFSQNMARSINDMVANYNLGKTRQRNIDSVQDTLTAAGIDQSQGVGAYIRNTAEQAKLGAISEAQYNNYFGNVQQWADTSTKLAAAEEDLIDNINATNLVYGRLTTNKNAAVLENGTLDTSLAAMTRQGLTNDWIAQKTKSIDFSDVADGAKTAAFTLKDLQSQFDSLYIASEQLAGPIDEASAALDSLTATGGYSSNSVDKIKNELNELRVSVEQGDTTFEDAKVKIQKYINEMERLSIMASEMDGKTAGRILAEGGTGAQRAKTDYDFAQIQEKAIAEKANSDQDSIDLQQNIKGVLDMIAAMQQLTFAVEAFHNLGSIWSNEDLTQGEKITQTIMNLTTVLFNATTGMKNFYDGMKGARGLFDSVKESIIKQAEAIQQKKLLEEQATQAELQNAQQRAQAEVAVAEAEKVTADTNVLKAETALQSAKANLEEAQASLSSLSADQAKIDNIKLIAQAHLTAAQAAIAHAEAEGRTVDPRAEADMLEAQESLSQISAEQIALNEKVTTATKAVSEAEQDVLQKEKELTKVREEANIANEKLVEKQNLLAEATNKLSSIVGVAANVKRTIDLFDSLKTVALDALDKMGLSVKDLVLKLAEVAPVLLPLMAFFGTAYGMFKDIEDRKAENSKNYEEAKAQLEDVQSLTEQANSFQQQYESQKGTEQPFDGLADSAREYAAALREAGEGDKAQKIENAALRAELLNTEDTYENLSNTIQEMTKELETSEYENMMNKAQAAISNTGESVAYLAKQEEELKNKRAELDSLSKDDPYRAQLENEIEKLEEFIAKNQEAYEAIDQLMNAQLSIGAQNVADAEGKNMHVFQAQDAATERAGTEALTPGAMNWSSIDQYFKEISPAYAAITSETERLAIAYQHVQTDAGKAAIQVRELLLANENLTEGAGVQTTYDANTGRALSQYNLIGREGIQTEMSDMGMYHEQQVQFLATLDENASESEIRTQLAELKQKMEEGQDFEVALKASVDPEQWDKMVKNQINSYEPTDEDVDADQFKSMANYLHEADESAFEEGGMFEDISPDIQDSADALEELVEGILRYDDAVSTLQEKEEEWRDALSDSADFEKRATAMKDLRETYSDFLDLSDDLSDTFVENADNLDLMAEAAAGDTDAYNELLAAASEDIAVHIYGIDETSQDLQTISTYLQSDAFKDIEVGMSLDPEDEAGFYTALNNMIAQGNWTRQDLDSYLKDIDCSLDPSGIEEGLTEAQEAAIAAGETIPENTTYTTTAETDTVQSEDTKEATSLEVTEKPGDTWHADVPTVTVQTAGMPAAISVPIQGTVPPSFEVKAKPIKSVDTQETTGSSMKTEKGGDGKFHLKNGSVKKNNSGGTKHNNASSPHASSPGGSCFIAGTLVTTLTGFKPIEEIQKGDIVLSYNEKIKVNEYSEVLQTMIHDTIEPIYTLHIKDEQLRVTGIHRFLVIDRITCGVPQWVHATDLKVGNWVMFADGSWHVIHKIDINIEHRIVYNFEVSHNHNYYVGHNQILAHNKGKSCFVAGTQISTINGLRVIESIQPNDIVLSYNEQTKCNEYSSVVQTMIHDTKEPIYTLYIQNEQLRVTGIHRFFVTNNIVNGIPEWIAAENLKVGQWVLFADGTWHVIHKIKVNIEQQTVYNFEVSGNHNYYVGRNQVLAHNKGNKGKKSCFVAGTQVSTSLGFKPIETIQPDDVVLSYNEQTGHNEYSSVIQTMIHDTIEPIYTLYVQNEKLRVTGIHRFFITKNILTNTSQWIAAENLKVGDWVLLADGTWHVIWKIEINIEHQTVYNFEVSGNHNYYVGYNQILAHNKGGGKAKTIEQKEKKEHKKDYYEEVNNQLEKTEKVLSKIEKEEDRLIGDKARANQNKQLTLLQKEIDLNNKKLKIQKQELKDVDALITKRDKLAEKTAAKQGVLAFIPDIQLDEDKIISNYEEISKAIDDTHNKLIEKYNTAAKAKNENLTKEIQKTIDKFDKYGEDLLKQAQRHNKLQSEIEETKATLEDLEDQMEDIRIDAYKAAQEALDNLKEIKESAAELDKLFRDFDPNSFMNKFSIDDTPYGDLTESLSKLDNMYSIAKEDANDFYQNLINQKRDAFNKTSDVDEQKAILSSIKFFEEQQSKLTNGANLENGLLGLAQQDLARLQEWIDNPAAKDNPFGKNEAALFEAYQDAYKRTLDYFKDYRELIQDTRDSIIDIYDDASDAIERQIDQFDRLIEKTERISDTYTLYYGEDSYDQLDKFYAQQGNIMQNQLDQLTAAYNYWQEQYQKALQTGDKKFIQEMKDRADEAEDAMLDAAQELAELWVEKFENAVEASSQHIYKNLFGSNDIDELADNWELQKDYMERYKDDVEKAYEIEKLRNKYLDLLDEAQGSSLQTQNKIRQQMQEQLDLLQNETTMSEYDVKLANAKLEILQKQMALEDAQRNKNKMQLRRDTQGNYRYVYTADQGDVRQAQQDLEDSEYDAYEMTKEETVANNDRAINLLQDYIEKRAAIWNKYKDDATARGQALAELEAEYEKIFLTLAEDFTDTSEGMYDILNWLVKNGSEDTTTAAINMLDTLYDKNGEIKEKTGQDWADMASFISNQVLPNIGEAVTRANLEMEDQATELKDAMVGSDGVLTKIGSGADDVKDSMDKAADATRLLANATDELFTAFGADDGKLQKALDKLAQYEQQLQNTQKTTSNLAGQLKQANQTIAAKNAEALHYQTTLDLLTGARNFKKGDTVTLKKGTWVWYARDEKQRDDKGNHGFALPEDTEIKIGSVEEKDSDGKLSKHHIGMRPTDTKVWGKPVADDPRKGGGTSNRKQQVWHLNPDEIIKAMKYDTGGYTGKWQDQTEDVKNGKLAVLHQKELILNATDTENILAAVTLMRDMTKGSILGLSNIGKIIPTELSSNVYGSTTEQRVEIQASFPNATDAEDIRAALLGLSDSAYQYAHRTI